MSILIVKFICMFIGVWFTGINVARMNKKESLSAVNLFCQAMGISGFVFLQWIL